jgi:hypothetical protein
MSHPSPDILLEYSEQRCEPATAARVEAHLAAGCGECAAELAVWARALDGIRSAAAPGAPEHVLQRAFNLVTRVPAEAGGWRRLLATLLLDTRSQPLPAGARDAGSEVFTLRYQAEAHRLELMAEPDGRAWRLHGQLTDEGRGCSGWKVRAEGVSGAQVTTDENGSFTLAGLTRGEYRLLLEDSVRRVRLELESIRLSAEAVGPGA